MLMSNTNISSLPSIATDHASVDHTVDPAQAVAHLTPEHWERANRHLVRKALSEFAHERLIDPLGLGSGNYRVTSDDGVTEYLFRADLLALDHWRIDAASIVRRRVASGRPLPLDALDLILDLREGLSLTPSVLPVYLEEISSTLTSAAFKLAAAPVSAGELAAADFQDVEAGMTEGHPCFVANNGRLGFDAAELLEYAPEAGRPTRLVWVAARREHTTFTGAADLEYEALIDGELGPDALEGFAAQLAGLGLDPNDYMLIPVHPWQWRNKLAVTYAGELARRDLVCLGYGEDTYRPQQSIRTFFNTAEPRKHYVKTALSILSMGFMRGLSAPHMEAAPAINDWLDGLIAADPVLTRAGFGILRERAAIGYRHRQYGAAGGKGSPYLRMLAALWRESPVPRLGPGERVMTMAALLHVARDGEPLAAVLIAESGRPAGEWLRAYLDAYLVPVLHSFYAYGLVYTPHGENVILVLDERGDVRRVLLKDVAEQIAVLDPATPLPARAERIRANVPEELRVLSVFTDVFDSFLRFLAAALDEEGALGEAAFWAVVGACVAEYQRANPRFAGRFEVYDLFAKRFPLSCLNRLQLRGDRQTADLEESANVLQLAGTLENPIAKHRPRIRAGKEGARAPVG
jgi:siderophore synthetase component